MICFDFSLLLSSRATRSRSCLHFLVSPKAKIGPAAREPREYPDRPVGIRIRWCALAESNPLESAPRPPCSQILSQFSSARRSAAGLYNWLPVLRSAPRRSVLGPSVCRSVGRTTGPPLLRGALPAENCSPSRGLGNARESRIEDLVVA